MSTTAYAAVGDRIWNKNNHLLVYVIAVRNATNVSPGSYKFYAIEGFEAQINVSDSNKWVYIEDKTKCPVLCGSPPFGKPYTLRAPLLKDGSVVLKLLYTNEFNRDLEYDRTDEEDITDYFCRQNAPIGKLGVLCDTGSCKNYKRNDSVGEMCRNMYESQNVSWWNFGTPYELDPPKVESQSAGEGWSSAQIAVVILGVMVATLLFNRQR